VRQTGDKFGLEALRVLKPWNNIVSDLLTVQNQLHFGFKNCASSGGLEVAQVRVRVTACRRSRSLIWQGVIDQILSGVILSMVILMSDFFQSFVVSINSKIFRDSEGKDLELRVSVPH